jgi:hypothetical protein
MVAFNSQVSPVATGNRRSVGGHQIASGRRFLSWRTMVSMRSLACCRFQIEMLPVADKRAELESRATGARRMVAMVS